MRVLPLIAGLLPSGFDNVVFAGHLDGHGRQRRVVTEPANGSPAAAVAGTIVPGWPLDRFLLLIYSSLCE
jgi:hypothetical protein